MMKTLRLLIAVPAALVMSLALTEANLAQVSRVQITPNSQAEPIRLQGTSGGSVSSNCGKIANAPNHVIQLTKPLPYLRLTVDSPGQPTLLIDGPGGRFCVLADDYSQNQPELTGYWQAGEYSLYIGELSASKHTYTLSISQQKQQIK